MKKHLFLEGLVQTGKSTLIRTCIAPYIEQVGGFSSQRILDKEGKVCGYRLVPANDLMLNAGYCPGATGVFIYHNGNVSKKDPSVFETLGVQLLSATKRKKLILLDEIGGSELLVPAFRDKLYQVLGGDLSCIGVLKLNDNARFMSKAAGYPCSIVEYNRRIRKHLLTKFDADIIPFDREKCHIVKKRVESFLDSIFC